MHYLFKQEGEIERVGNKSISKKFRLLQKYYTYFVAPSQCNSIADCQCEAKLNFCNQNYNFFNTIIKKK